MVVQMSIRFIFQQVGAAEMEVFHSNVTLAEEEWRLHW